MNKKSSFFKFHNSPFDTTKIQIFNSTHLKLIAILTMLLDHIGILFDIGFLRIIGRIAFPIFAFQIAEGYIYTSNVPKYILKLFVFAIISEVPYDLFTNNALFDMKSQNVMFTLLFGLIVICCIDVIKNKPSLKKFGLAVFGILFCFVFSIALFSDYNLFGVLTVVTFYLCRNFKFAWIAQTICIVLISVCLGGTQLFALLSLPFIWLYNGKKGRGGKILQYGAYSFYPIHQLILYAIPFFKQIFLN